MQAVGSVQRPLQLVKATAVLLCRDSRTACAIGSVVILPWHAMQAVGSGLVPALLPCLTQGSLHLACAIVEALMQIMIAVQGKQAMVSGIGP